MVANINKKIKCFPRLCKVLRLC